MFVRWSTPSLGPSLRAAVVAPAPGFGAVGGPRPGPGDALCGARGPGQGRRRGKAPAPWCPNRGREKGWSSDQGDVGCRGAEDELRLGDERGLGAGGCRRKVSSSYTQNLVYNALVIGQTMFFIVAYSGHATSYAFQVYRTVMTLVPHGLITAVS